MTTPPKAAPLTPAFEVPDLDLGPLPVAARPRSGAHPIRRPAASSPDPSGDFELDTSADAGFELASDGGSDARAPAQRAHFGATLASNADFELDEAMALEAVAPVVDARPWPRGREAEANQRQLTPLGVSECAGYGTSRVPFYLAPGYTWRVWNRRRALARELASRQTEFRARARERDRALVDLALSLVGALEKQDRFRGMLDELRATTGAFQAQQQALAATNTGLNQALQVHESKLAALEPERCERQKLVDARISERDAKLIDHDRASAKLKRVQIEIRNATQKGRALVGPQGGALPQDLAAQLSALTQTETALSREVAQHQAELDRTNAALAHSQQPLGESLRAMDAIRQQKRLLVQSTQQKLESEGSQLQSAEAVHTEVAKQIALAVLDLKGSIPVERTVLDRIQAADDRVEAAAIEVDKRNLALDAYDRPSYSLGLKLALAPFAFIVLLVLLRAIL